MGLIMIWLYYIYNTVIMNSEYDVNMVGCVLPHVNHNETTWLIGSKIKESRRDCHSTHLERKKSKESELTLSLQ